MKPFLKWAGGKRWLAKKLVAQFPRDFNRYIEPFVGSGAVFFHLAPDRAILSDANSDLIETYIAVRDFPFDVYEQLRILQMIHSKEIYYSVRGLNPRTPAERAARFIYLNRTCWNGLYRVNRKNEFNVPIGTKDSVLLDGDDFAQTAHLLKRAKISSCDFEESINLAGRGDLIYVDPPYCPKAATGVFLKYNSDVFNWLDQVRLQKCLAAARDRGAYVAISNVNSSCVRDLYLENWAQRTVPRTSVISASSNFRSETTELLVTGHER